jgi:hypothetical protein
MGGKLVGTNPIKPTTMSGPKLNQQQVLNADSTKVLLHFFFHACPLPRCSIELCLSGQKNLGPTLSIFGLQIGPKLLINARTLTSGY